MLFVLLISFSSHLKFQGGCALKCQKAPLLASNIPLLLFSLKAFPKPRKFSQWVIGLNMKVQGSYYNPHPMGDGSPWPSILPTDNSEVHPTWFPMVLSRINPVPHSCNKINYVPFKKKKKKKKLLLLLVSLSLHSAASWDHIPNKLPAPKSLSYSLFWIKSWLWRMLRN